MSSQWPRCRDRGWRGCLRSRAHAMPQCHTGTGARAHTVPPSPAASLTWSWWMSVAKFSLCGISASLSRARRHLSHRSLCLGLLDSAGPIIRVKCSSPVQAIDKTDGLELGERTASQEPPGAGALPPPAASLILLHISVLSSLLSAFSSSV